MIGHGESGLGLSIYIHGSTLSYDSYSACVVCKVSEANKYMSEKGRLDAEREARFGRGYDPRVQPEVAPRALSFVRIHDHSGNSHIFRIYSLQKLCSRLGAVILLANPLQLWTSAAQPASLQLSNCHTVQHCDVPVDSDNVKVPPMSYPI